MGTVTVNGKPVEEFVAAELGREIAEVAKIEEKRYRRPPIVTKHKGNHSGSRTAPCEVVYTADQKATHVIVAGQLFSWAQKSPFVKSGQSVLGALEYDERTDEVKCHECGKWRIALGRHVREHAPLTFKQYKVKHGFAISRSLIGPVTKEKFRSSVAASALRPGEGFHEMQKSHKKSISSRAKNALIRHRSVGGLLSVSPELDNLRGRCMAQRLEQLRQFAKELGRTPTKIELESRRNLVPSSLRRLFRLPMREIIAMAGLVPNRPGAVVTKEGIAAIRRNGLLASSKHTVDYWRERMIRINEARRKKAKQLAV